MTAIRALVNYAARTDFRQRYYANDLARDPVVIDGQERMIVNGRGVSTSLDREGCCLVAHRSDVAYFEDRDAVPARHPAEIIDGASGPDAKTWASD